MDDLEKYQRKIRQKQAIERLLDTDDGKTLLEYLSDLLLFDIGQFCDNNNAMHYREGRRSVFTNLLALKAYDLQRYIEQVKLLQMDRINERNV